MATIIYVTGNGYNCGCCRRTDTDSFDFETDDDAIAESVEAASYADWDFYIKSIIGYDGDETDLENRIMSAIARAEEEKDRKLKIEQIQKDIAYTESWFTELESTKASRTAYLTEKRKELEELLK